MAQVRMVNIQTGQVKYMPEATSKLATIRSRWRIEDPAISETKPVETAPSKIEEFLDKTQAALDAIDARKTAAAIQPTEAPKPKAKKKKAQPKK